LSSAEKESGKLKNSNLPKTTDAKRRSLSMSTGTTDTPDRRRVVTGPDGRLLVNVPAKRTYGRYPPPKDAEIQRLKGRMNRLIREYNIPEDEEV